MCISWLSAQGAERSEKAAQILMWAQRLTDQFIRDEIILPENAEVVRYGLETLVGNMLAFLMTAVVGFFYGSLFSGIVLWLLIFPLRKYAGGYHAKTKARCYLMSIGMLVFAFALLYQPNHHQGVYVFIVIISGVYIYMNVPIDNDNKVLDATERKVYRKCARIVLGVESILFAVVCIAGWKDLAAVVAMCFGIVGMSLVVGKHFCEMG